jgi:hypothetical protein
MGIRKSSNSRSKRALKSMCKTEKRNSSRPSSHASDHRSLLLLCFGCHVLLRFSICFARSCRRIIRNCAFACSHCIRVSFCLGPIDQSDRREFRTSGLSDCETKCFDYSSVSLLRASVRLEPVFLVLMTKALM